MLKRKTLITMAIIGALAIPVSVFAANSDSSAAKSIRGFFGIDTAKLTDSQKADITDYTQRMAQLEKEFLDKMVSNGTITQEQADTAISEIDKSVEEGTFIRGMGLGLKGENGRHRMGQKGGMTIDFSQLTDQQKADFTPIYEKMSDLHKEFINKQVELGLITQAQADNALERINEIQSTFGTGNGMMMGFKGIGAGMHGSDLTSLTDEQKTYFESYNSSIKELQKEFINKAAENGALTQEQADNALEMIENMPDFSEKGNFQKGNGRMKGRGPGRGQLNDGGTGAEIR